MDLVSALRLNSKRIGMVLAIDYRSLPFFIFDFSAKNKEFKRIHPSEPKEFHEYIVQEIFNHKAVFGIGKYCEDRVIYNNISLFDDAHKRTIHLGIDLFVSQGTEVLAPLDGKVHSLANNNIIGDYGPTIILEHELEGIRFYTLYGHLDLDSLRRVEVGQIVKSGTVIGRVGMYSTNGNWPPHLHFQIINHMQGRNGDFPGVASSEDKQRFLENCPDPNLILQIKTL